MSNVILISFDALRYDHLCDENASPFLNRIKSSGVWFDQHISTGSGTSTSFPGIHASALPLDHGYAGLDKNHESLAERLQQSGVQTLGITAQTSCSSLYNYDRGFDTFRDWVDEEGLNETGQPSMSAQIKDRTADVVESLPGVSTVAYKVIQKYREKNPPPCPYKQASEITAESLSLVDEHIDPAEDYFIWVHYMEPHQPYYPPQDCIDTFHDGEFDVGRIYRTVRDVKKSRPEISNGTMKDAISSSEREAISEFYAAATRYADREAKRLVNGFESRGLLDDTTLIVTADHGEELFDHGDFGHPPKLYDELIRVPLLVDDRSGRLPGSMDIDAVTSHLDLAPTIVDLFGIDASPNWRGRSFRPQLSNNGSFDHGDRAIAELCHTSGLGGSVETDKIIAAVRTAEWKYIENRQLNTEELYRLSTDPAEMENVIDEFPQQATDLRTTLESRLSEVTEERKSVEINEAAKRRLEKLGYKEKD